MLNILTHFKKKCESEWAYIKVGDVEFRASAKIRRGQAFLIVDAPRDLVSVTREKLRIKTEEERKEYERRVLGKL